MTQQQKDELNKELCGLLGICWHEFMEKEYRCTHCDAPDYEKNPDFTSEAGRVQLLKLMSKRPDFIRFLLSTFVWLYSPDALSAHWADMFLDDNGAFAIAARDFLKAMEAKE